MRDKVVEYVLHDGLHFDVPIARVRVRVLRVQGTLPRHVVSRGVARPGNLTTNQHRQQGTLRGNQETETILERSVVLVPAPTATVALHAEQLDRATLTQNAGEKKRLIEIENSRKEGTAHERRERFDERIRADRRSPLVVVV